MPGQQMRDKQLLFLVAAEPISGRFMAEPGQEFRYGGLGEPRGGLPAKNQS